MSELEANLVCIMSSRTIRPINLCLKTNKANKTKKHCVNFHPCNKMPQIHTFYFGSRSQFRVSLQRRSEDEVQLTAWGREGRERINICCPFSPHLYSRRISLLPVIDPGMPRCVPIISEASVLFIGTVPIRPVAEDWSPAADTVLRGRTALK